MGGGGVSGWGGKRVLLGVGWCLERVLDVACLLEGIDCMYSGFCDLVI